MGKVRECKLTSASVTDLAWNDEDLQGTYWSILATNGKVVKIHSNSFPIRSEGNDERF